MSLRVFNPEDFAAGRTSSFELDADRALTFGHARDSVGLARVDLDDEDLTHEALLDAEAFSTGEVEMTHLRLTDRTADAISLGVF